MREMYGPYGLEDESSRMDLYRPQYSQPAQIYSRVSYPTKMDPKPLKPSPTVSQDPFTTAPRQMQQQ